jgi:hypothetical protein
MGKTDKIERAVVITTAKRGVFFGYSQEKGEAIISRGTVTLSKARMCTHWSKDTHGVLGLAGIGPQKGSRIGPRVPELTCESVTAVMVCSNEAAKAWESESWSS